jgi:hypothetical protein
MRDMGRESIATHPSIHWVRSVPATSSSPDGPSKIEESANVYPSLLPISSSHIISAAAARTMSGTSHHCMH